MTLVAFALAAGLVAAQLPARDTPRPAAKGTAVIKGFVVDAHTGAPVRRATIRVNGGGQFETVRADAEGRFELRGLPAGKYFLAGSRSGYLQTSFGQRASNAPGTPLEILAGQQVEKVRIAMFRGGVISGRVFDEFGEPVSGVHVQALQYRYQAGVRQLLNAFGAAGPVRTDDLGGFRLYGLQPGQYLVSARPMTMMLRDAADGTGIVTTYFPNAPDEAGAQRMTVGAGKEVSGINISLITGRVARIRGRAVMSTGEPFANSYVSLMQRIGGISSSTSGGSVRADGTFEIAGVPAGQHLMTVRPQQMGPRENDDVEVGRTVITVTGDDIDGVMLIGARGAIVRGRIVTDEGVPMPYPPARTAVMVNVGPEEPGGNRRGEVNDDYSFEIKGLFGRGRISAMTMFMPGDAPAARPGARWAPKAVVWRGQDVTDKGLDFDPGQVLDGIEIVFSRKWAELSGVVVDERNQPAGQISLLLFAADENRWFPQSRYVRPTQTDGDGKYRAPTLLAGDYLVAVVTSMEPGQHEDPEFLRSLVDRATRLSIGDGETKVQNLTISRQ